MHSEEFVNQNTSFPFTSIYECTECNSKFSSMRNLSDHNRKVHSPGNKRMVKCSHCNVRCFSFQNLAHHMQKLHDKTINIIHKDFLLHDEFIKWKKEEEEGSNILFVKRGCAQHCKDNSYYYYYCNGSGTHQSTSSGNRKVQPEESCKTVLQCSAFIFASVCKSSRSVKVSYCFDHCGHYTSMTHKLMSNDETLRDAIHMQPEVHELEKTLDSSMQKVECSICYSKFCSKKTLQMHNRKFHSTEETQAVKCGHCKVRCFSIQSLAHHLQKYHGKDINISHRDFSSFEDFIRWKKEEEKKSTAWFVKRSGVRHFNHKSYHHYYCNRSGLYRRKSVGIRKLKPQGSCKTVLHCSAFISATVNNLNGSVKVDYCLDHSGHEISVAHMRMSKETRLKIADQLAMGMKIDSILNNVHDNTSEVTRDSLITRRDIHNIKHQFNIRASEEYSNHSVDDCDLKTENVEQTPINQVQNTAYIEETLSNASKSNSLSTAKTELLSSTKQLINLIESTTSLDVVNTVMKHISLAMTFARTIEIPSPEDNAASVEIVKHETAEVCNICCDDVPPDGDTENVLWIHCSKCNTWIHEVCAGNCDAYSKFSCKCK